MWVDQVINEMKASPANSSHVLDISCNLDTNDLTLG